jgi:hypothetical protein
MSDNRSIQASGTILYPSPDAKLMGAVSPEWGRFSSENADLLKSVGANTMREFIVPSWWQNDISHPIDPNIKYQAKHLQIKQWLKERNIKYYMGTWGTWVWNPPEGWNNAKAKVILNIDGLQDKWIKDVGDIIQTLQPDIVDVMGEPPDDIANTVYAGTMTQEEFYATYRQFVVRAIEAWRTIKPDLACVVYSMPFWYLQPMTATPIPKPNIIYPVDFYYSYEGNYPPDYEAWAQKYWNGDLAGGKAGLLSYFLSHGVDGAAAAGLEVIFAETGANLGNPNALIFMQDLYDYAKSKGIGVLHECFRAYPSYGTGILNSDWTTLNQMGEVWTRNIRG